MAEIDLVLKIQQASGKFLDYIMFFFTQFGDESVFLLVAIILFWCVDKRFAYKFVIVFLFGQLFIGGFKTLFSRARPYQSGAKAIMHSSSGYSFPSGHSHSIANISTQLVLYVDDFHPKKVKSALICGVFITTMVMFTRIYLGQHYLSDVVAGAMIGIIVAITFSKLFDFFCKNEEKLVYLFLPASLFLAILFFNAHEDIAKILGGLGAVSLGYFFEKHYVGYEVKSKKFYHNIIKIALGGAVLIALKEGIKQIGIKLEFNEELTFFLDYLRYFIIGLTASFVAPLAFKTLKI